MIKNAKGFTLLELLIAATIIGGLAVLATASYRASVAETRIQAAKARTEVLAGAVERFKSDYPRLQFTATTEITDQNDFSCSSLSGNAAPYLLPCGYIEKGGWSDGYVSFYVCKGKSGGCVNSKVANPLACMKGKNNAKLPAKYKGTYAYCVSESAKGD